MAAFLVGSILSGALGVVAVVVALITAIVGVLSFFVSTAGGNKQTRLQRGVDAYRAVLTWRRLWEQVQQPGDTKAVDLWDRLTAAREETAYHTAMLYGESQPLACKYHALTTAVRDAYEQEIVDVLTGTIDGKTLRPKDPATTETEKTTRQDYLAALKRGASFYRNLRRLHLREPLRDPPTWL